MRVKMYLDADADTFSRCLWLELVNARLLLPLFQSSSSSTRSSLKPYQATCPPLPPCTATPSSMISQLAKLRNLIIFFFLLFFFDRGKLLNNFPPPPCQESIDLSAKLMIKIQIHRGGGVFQLRYRYARPAVR